MLSVYYFVILFGSLFQPVTNGQIFVTSLDIQYINGLLRRSAYTE